MSTRKSRSSSRSQNSRSPRSPRSPQKPLSLEDELRKIETAYPDVKDPDIAELRKTIKPGKGTCVGDPSRLQTIEHRKPEKMTAIEKLRILKRQAIAECDFDKSNAIQRYLDLKTIDSTDTAIRKAEQWIKEGIEAALENYEANVEDIEREAADKRIKIRSECDVLFQDMQKRHLEELTEIYMEEEISRQREANREPCDYRGMKRQAQKLAQADDTESAKMVSKQADDFRDQNAKARIEEVEKKYQRIVDHQIRKQKAELEGAQKQLSDLLQEVGRQLECDLRDQKKKAAVYIKHCLLVATQASCDWLEKVEARTKVTTELNSFVTDFLKKKEKEDLLSLTD